jgi:hypothetical protein
VKTHLKNIVGSVKKIMKQSTSIVYQYMFVEAKVGNQTQYSKIHVKITNSRCIFTTRQIHRIFVFLNLVPNFFHQVYIWMDYGSASFHIFKKCINMFFRRVFTIPPMRWFPLNIFVQDPTCCTV